MRKGLTIKAVVKSENEEYSFRKCAPSVPSLSPLRSSALPARCPQTKNQSEGIKLPSLPDSLLHLQVNGDWISDLGDTISGAASSVASTLGDKKTWDQVQAAFESILTHKIGPFFKLYLRDDITVHLKVLESVQPTGRQRRGPPLKRESSA